MPAAFPVNGRVALITGAARGIGLETARQLHARGCDVVVADLDAGEAQAAATSIGERAVGVGADVVDPEALEAAVALTIERFGGLDVVVANAGIAPPARTVRAIDADAFERVVEVDLLGVWRTVRAALPQIVDRRGQVVLVASIYAFLNGVGNASYAASKAGVEQLGRALRVELAPFGAGATVAYPGFAETKMVQEAFADPVAAELEDALPSFVFRRTTPERVATALVNGIERRAPRVVVPRWWRVLAGLRGVLNPAIDARLARDRRLADVIRRADGDG